MQLLTDAARIDTWVDRYVAKYGSEVPEAMASATSFARTPCSRSCPTVAFAIIEREDEFATRATRWRFP